MTLKNVFDVPIAAEEHHAHQLIIGTYQAKHRRLTSRGARGTLVNFLCSCAVRRQNTGPKGAGGFLHSRNECYQDTCPIVKDSACVGVCRHTLQPLMRDALVLLGLSLENIDKVQLAFCLLSVPHMSKDVNPHLLRSDLGERFESRQKDLS